MTKQEAIEIDQAARFIRELAATSAQVKTYVEITRIHQPGQTYAPIALQFPALDDRITDLPEHLRH